MQSIAGQNAVIDAQRQDDWFKDGEMSLRYYRNIDIYEVALYGYHGFWKSPMGMNANGAYFPELNTYGTSGKSTHRKRTL